MSYFDKLFSDNPDSWKPFFQYHQQLYKKLDEMMDMVDSLEASMEEDEASKMEISMLRTNLHIAQAKLAGAHALTNIYSALMENAGIVVVNMKEFKVGLFSAEHFAGADSGYIKVLRDEVENFRLIFVDWLKTFDKTKDYPDEWHMFNNPDDFPPDEDEEGGFFPEDFEDDDDE